MSESEVVDSEPRDAAATLAQRLRRAETLVRIASQVDYGRPLPEVLEALAREIVEETQAVAASLVLLDARDLSAIAVGMCNLPPGYVEGMIRARQDAGTGDPLRRAIAANQTWVIRDARNYLSGQPEYAGMREVLRNLPYDTLVATPFHIRKGAYGVVYLYYPDDTEVDSDEAAFARAIAERAAPVMDNALLFSETQRRSAELEALHHADEALHRSLHLNDVLDAMVEFAIELLGADSGLVISWNENDRLAVQAIRGLDNEYRELLDRIYGRHPREYFTSMATRLPTNLVPDISQQPALVAQLGDRASGALAEVPVFIGEDFWGMFNIGWSRPRSFSEVDRRLFDAFASRASLAIQNALLFRETRRRTTEMEALQRADEALHRSLHLDDVIEAMAELSMELLGADSSMVATWDETGELGVKTSRGLRPDFLSNVDRVYRTFPPEQFAATRPLDTSIVEDISKVPILVERMGAAAVGAMAEVAIVIDGDFWGVFSIGWRRPRRFSDGERRLIDAFASRVSLAIQNALLFERAQEAASMEERQRLARDLHDSVSQALYGIGLGARTARKRLADAPAAHLEPIDYIISLAESGLAETRALIFELVPESLAEQGLALALQRLGALTQARHNLPVTVTLCDEPDIPVKAKEALYRIAQESLNNIAKHAQATAVTVALASGEGALTLSIRDDGRGFDTSGEFPGHFGLRSMEERATRAGGAFAIESASGRGTTVSVSLTVPRE